MKGIEGCEAGPIGDRDARPELLAIAGWVSVAGWDQGRGGGFFGFTHKWFFLFVL
jgi:hypothetical protein